MPDNAGDGEILQAIQKFIAEYQELVDKIESLPHEPDWENIKDTIEEHRPESTRIRSYMGDENGHVEINLDTGEINIEDGTGTRSTSTMGSSLTKTGTNRRLGTTGL